MFFVIEPVEGSHAWLRRLLIFRSNTKMAVFLLVFDWIAEEAERQGYESLIVSVNDQVRAELLELIQFKKIYETPLNEELPGEWYEKVAARFEKHIIARCLFSAHNKRKKN